ncbi:peptidylprolyl isomerase [Sphingomonas sp.]|uniref:peptidylprolyl isomerase n=1 Tax=Sphingomonas sp. TaxID=28214 RepID=UPI0025F64589|nr:peptidylprolyl isomerase [Sphingomonas sp.]MBV9528063.1 peptidylprolyl isomerase [Sphingomonas sp.]
MRSLLLAAVAALLVGAAPAKKSQTPGDVIAASPASAWRAIDPDDLLVIDLAGGGRIVIQLAPQFAPVHVANIKALARGHYWDGATIYRLQDNYVAQWGLNESDKPWPTGVVAKPPAEYTRPLAGLAVRPLGYVDPYAPGVGYADGWPIAYDRKAGWATLTHCYGSVGVGRDLAPDTGTGGELYAVIGGPARALDRNIALVGRVLEGIDRLSALPRGTGDLGFYKDKAQYVPITAIRIASDMPAADRPAFEYLDPQSAVFATWLRVKANRKDDFYEVPAGGVDLCNAAVPIRKKG